MDETQPQVQSTEQSAYIENLQRMQMIVREMKEIPELPSEIPTDVHALTKVEFPEEGGVLTYMEGYDLPYRGFPFFEFVDKIDLIKKLSRQIQSGFYHALKDSPLKYLLIPLIPYLGTRLFWAFTYTFHRLIERFRLKTIRYCQFVRELHRACSIEYIGEDERIKEIRFMLRDIECMILEFDNAYRFRMQDILEEMDKEALKKDPIKEICRFLDIMIDREVKVEVKDTWRLLQMFTKYYLRFDKKFLDMIVRVLLELDIEKCKLSEEDKYYCKPRTDYVFGFQKN